MIKNYILIKINVITSINRMRYELYILINNRNQISILIAKRL